MNEPFQLTSALENHSAGRVEYKPEDETVKKQTDTPWDKFLFTLRDAYKYREPLTYTVDGLFSNPSLNIAFGNPGTLKSLLLADCAVHIATGDAWLGKKVKQASSMWLDLDNGKRRTHERFESIGRKAQAFVETPLYYVSMKPFNAGKEKDINELQETMLMLGIKFLVIDNLGLISPGVDENSDGMIPIMAKLRWLAETTGAAIVLIHHQRKSTAKRAGETLRGHTGIESSVDLCLLVERDGESNFIKIKSTKSRDMDVEPFAAEFCFTHKDNSNELYEAWFEALEFQDTTSDKAIEKVIIDIVTETPLINQKNLLTSAKSVLQASKNRIRLVVASLEQKNRLKVKEAAHNAKLYLIE
jgi:predicted ATP-dependent serine protease